MTLKRVSNIVIGTAAATFGEWLAASGNQAIGGVGSYGGGLGVMFLKDAATVPTTNPTGGGILYSQAGVPKWRDPAGVITTLGAGAGFVDTSTNQSIGGNKVFTGAAPQSTGAAAGWVFQDRSGSALWQWYATSNIARLNNGTSDVVTVTTAGTTTFSGSVSAALVSSVAFRDNDNHTWEGVGNGMWRFRNTWATANAGYVFTGGPSNVDLLTIDGNANVGIGGASPTFGGGVGVTYFKDATTVPTTNPTGGGIFYSQAGVPKWRDPAGVVTPLTKTYSDRLFARTYFR